MCAQANDRTTYEEIELDPLEYFYANAPASLTTKPETDAVMDTEEASASAPTEGLDEHQLFLNRLDFEKLERERSLLIAAERV